MKGPNKHKNSIIENNSKKQRGSTKPKYPIIMAKIIIINKIFQKIALIKSQIKFKIYQTVITYKRIIKIVGLK
jgi:hypothetical protein